MKKLKAKELLLQPAIVLLALIPIFPKVFAEGERLVPGSYLYQYPPWSLERPADLPEQNPLGREVPMSVSVWYTLCEQAFDQGEWPLWNPMQYTGAPLIGTFQSAVFYPPRLLFRVFDDVHLATTIYILLRFWLCGINAFICARLLGIRVSAARFFSLAYMLVGYNLLWCYYPPPDVMAWFPYLFLGMESLLEQKYRRGFALMAFASVLCILPGHPSSIITAGTGLALYALLRLVLDNRGLPHAARCVALAASAAVAALAVSAVQLLPFLEYLPRAVLTIEVLVEDGTAHYTYNAIDLFSLWAPRFLGTELEETFWGVTNHTYLGMLYASIPVWVAALLLFSRLGLTRKEQLHLRCLLIASLVMLYMATNLPGTAIVHGLPIVKAVRPAYFLSFAAFAFPLAATISLQAWIREKRDVKNLMKPALAAAGLAAMLFAGFLFARTVSYEYSDVLDRNSDLPSYIQRQALIALAFAALSFLTLAVGATAGNRMRYVAPVLCLLLVADQAVGIHRVLGTTPPEYLYPENELTDYLQEFETPTRFRLSTLGLPPGYAVQYRIEQLFGYDAVVPARFQAYLEELTPLVGTEESLALACRYAVFPAHEELPEGYRTVHRVKGAYVAEPVSPIARVRLVKDLRVFSSSEDVFEYMKTDEFDPHVTACTDAPIEWKAPANGQAGTAEITDWSWNSYGVEIAGDSPAALVAADLYYPGWTATIDGTPAEIFPVYNIFRGIIVPEGKHTVRFKYLPRSFTIGYVLSTALLVAGAFYALGRLWRLRAHYPAAGQTVHRNSE